MRPRGAKKLARHRNLFTKNNFILSGVQVGFERRDGAIRLIRSKRTLTTEITPQSAARDNERIEEFDNSKGQIFWDLDSGDVKKQTFVVPATYEIDWLRDDSACLAPKRRP